VNQTLTGIVLRHKPLFESKWQIMLLTPSQGRVYALSRSPSKKNPFQGHLEPSNRVELSVFQGKTFTYINHGQAIETFSSLRTNYSHFEFTMHVFNLIIRSTMIQQPSPELYELLLSTLRKLKESPNLTELRQTVERDILTCEGLGGNECESYSDQLKRYTN
jgi:DNA repair protein RecO|tara:strand:+ start:10495 stop:10980 length:486 start_codon:yes stop_codon:yes gene_type:complete